MNWQAIKQNKCVQLNTFVRKLCACYNVKCVIKIEVL